MRQHNLMLIPSTVIFFFLTKGGRVATATSLLHMQELEETPKSPLIWNKDVFPVASSCTNLRWSKCLPWSGPPWWGPEPWNEASDGADMRQRGFFFFFMIPAPRGGEVLQSAGMLIRTCTSRGCSGRNRPSHGVTVIRPRSTRISVVCGRQG